MRVDVALCSYVEGRVRAIAHAQEETYDSLTLEALDQFGTLAADSCGAIQRKE